MLHLSNAPLIMVTIISHLFTNILQTTHILAMKFTEGYEKNVSYFWYQKLKKSDKKSCFINQGSVRYYYYDNFFWRLHGSDFAI